MSYSSTEMSRGALRSYVDSLENEYTTTPGGLPTPVDETPTVLYEAEQTDNQVKNKKDKVFVNFVDFSRMNTWLMRPEIRYWLNSVKPLKEEVAERMKKELGVVPTDYCMIAMRKNPDLCWDIDKTRFKLFINKDQKTESQPEEAVKKEEDDDSYGVKITVDDMHRLWKTFAISTPTSTKPANSASAPAIKSQSTESPIIGRVNGKETIYR